MHTVTSRASSLKSLLQVCLISLIPSFISSRIWPDPNRRPTRLRSSAYLDGMRGVAAFNVYLYHFTATQTKELLRPYGSNPERDHSILQLPWVGIISSGAPMVHLFFVISGFALAYRPLQLLYDMDMGPSKAPTSLNIAKSHRAIASSAIRRPLRLFLPAMVQTLTAALLISFGWVRPFVARQDTLYLQLRDWLKDGVYAIMYPWKWDSVNHSVYDPHMWTLPVEFTQSLLLFLVLTFLAPLRSARLRQLFLVSLCFYYLMVTAAWSSYNFTFGALLADLHMHRLATQAAEGTSLVPPTPSTPSDNAFSSRFPNRVTFVRAAGIAYRSRVGRWVRALGKLSLTIAVLYIMAWHTGYETETYKWIASQAPTAFTGGNNSRGYIFWLSTASTTLVLLVSRTPLYQRVFETAPIQYLGRISYALYICHHLVLTRFETVIIGTYPKDDTPGTGLRSIFGQESITQVTLLWFVGVTIFTTIVVVYADFLMRVVDEPSVRLARKMETYLYRSAQDLMERPSSPLPSTEKAVE